MVERLWPGGRQVPPGLRSDHGSSTLCARLAGDPSQGLTAVTAAPGSTLLLTLLLGVGLLFFLRAAAKDRTTDVVISSYSGSLEVLEALTDWLRQRGWRQLEADPERRWIAYEARVGASVPLALLLSLLAAAGAGALALVVIQLVVPARWWPLLLAGFGPLAGLVYLTRAERLERLELRLLSHDQQIPTRLALRAHRDELIALLQELAAELGLEADRPLPSATI